mgnify:CR=1 FL=1
MNKKRTKIDKKAYCRKGEVVRGDGGAGAVAGAGVRIDMFAPPIRTDREKGETLVVDMHSQGTNSQPVAICLLQTKFKPLSLCLTRSQTVRQIIRERCSE